MSLFPKVGSTSIQHQQTIKRLEGEIARGVKDGTLTSPEAQKLYRQLDQLKSQASRVAAGLFGGAIKNAQVNAAAASLEKNINAERSNSQVDFAKLARSNIGTTAQRLARLERAIDQGAANGRLSPKEQAFLRAELNSIKQAFSQAVGRDGKLDATEQDQLNQMQRRLARDTFAATHNRDNPFTQYEPPTPNKVTTMAVGEEGGGGLQPQPSQPPKFYTMAVGEEGGSPQPSPSFTTKMTGEEGGSF